jgi:hypothetical protein
MGYTTEFRGGFTIKGDITQEQIDYINKFSETRRMKRDNAKLMELFKGEHGLPGADKTNADAVYGIQGEYFVGGLGFAGQQNDASVINGNSPSTTQPGLWCQWVIADNRLEWNGAEKFYDYTEWLEYLVENFFKPWGLEMSGEVEWRGEDWDDTGTICINGYNVGTF